MVFSYFLCLYCTLGFADRGWQIELRGRQAKHVRWPRWCKCRWMVEI